ncbi:MAG: hypothetical protein ABSB78_14140 [Bacteroidota bacterium]
MKFTIRSALFVLLITFSAACGPVVTPKPTEHSATLPAITQTYAPTETNTPTVTNTPTKTNTPSETPIPTPDFYDGLPRDRGDLVRITPEQASLKVADILAHPKLKEKPTHKYTIEVNNTGAEEDIFITCWYGNSCLIDTGATIINPDGGPDMDVLFIEFINPNGTHRAAVVCIDGASVNIITSVADNEINWLQEVIPGQALIITIIKTTTSGGPDNPDNPVMIGLTNNAPEINKTILKKLWQNGQRGGTSVLPDDIEKIILYGSVIVSQVPQS